MSEHIADKDFERKRINPYKTGANIRRFRKKKGLTVIRMSDLIGVTAAAVYRWEEGEAMPMLDHVHNICKLLDKPFEIVFVYE